MKVNNIKLTLCGAALLMAAGCQRSEPDTPTINPSQPLEVSVGLNAVSRAVVADQFGNGASINVLMLDPVETTTPTGDYDKQAIYTYKQPSDAAGIWVLEPGTEFLVTGKTADVLAHYPAVIADGILSADKRSLNLPVREVVDIGDIEHYNSSHAIRVEFQTGIETEVILPVDEIDYMTGSAARVGNDVKKAKITMQHAQAMIALRVYNALENTNRTQLKEFSLKNKTGKTALTKGTVALADNAWTPSSTTVSYTRTMSGFEIGTYFATLVSPATIAADDVELSITLGEASYTFTLPKKDWVAGKIILYEVEVTSNSATLNTGVKVLDWDDAVNVHELELN